MFVVSYVDYKNPQTLNTQTTKTIVIGRSNTTNALEFYHPHTKNIITSTFYKCDETLPAGPTFNLPYDGGFHFNKYVEPTVDTRPPTYPPQSTVYTRNNENKYDKMQVIAIPMQNSGIYTLQSTSGDLHINSKKKIFCQMTQLNPFHKKRQQHQRGQSGLHRILTTLCS